MRRPYTRRRFLEIVAQLRAVQPGIALSTDIIVGFPGETEEEFEETRTLFEEVGFDMAFIFKYSERSGTRAAEWPDDVPAEVKEARNQILLEALGRHSLARNQALLGTVQEVLLEGPARRGERMFMGRNPGNRKVLVPADSRLVGQSVPVLIREAHVTYLQGELLLSGVDEALVSANSHVSEP
jgi:tRNA-2-methylthio-N6-dimethylallyladenosine synthase